MSGKRKLRRRIGELEHDLFVARFAEAPTFQRVTVCWSARTVTIGQRCVQAGPQDCFEFPVRS